MGRAKIIPEDTLFLPFQKHWVEDKARLKLMEKGRQIGVSWSSAEGLVERKSLKGARYDAWVSSRDEIQAKLFIEDCKAFAGLLEIGAEDLGEQVFGDEKATGYVLKFANGCRINSLSSSPDAQAGKRGDRLLDEFALHKDPRKLYAIAYPGITWGGKLEIVSTHRGSANYFAELIREIKEKGNPKGFSLHTVTLQTALDQGFLFKLQAKLPSDDPVQEMDEAEYFNFIKAGCADEESFLQEYMCIAADDNSAFLTYDMIAACEYTYADGDWQTDLKMIPRLYAGVDIGRKNDLFVIWVNEYAGLRHMTRKIVTLKNKKFSEMRSALYEILELPAVRRCCIDDTGIGMQLAEEAQDKFGKYKVEAVTFTPAVHEELAYPLRAAFEDLNLRIPEDKMIRAHLRGIKKETTKAGNIRFAADRGKDGHSDYFWALALAVHAKGKNDGLIKVASAGSGRSDSKDRSFLQPPHRRIFKNKTSLTGTYC
jgi:phage FluMu gp28-like protein